MKHPIVITSDGKILHRDKLRRKNISMNQIISKIKQEIMAKEDSMIFDILDKIGK